MKINSSIGLLIIKVLNYYLPPVLWAGIIFLLSAQSALPTLSASPLDFLFKKMSHIFVYAVLFLLIHRALTRTHRQITLIPTIWLWTLLFCLLYATGDELHQSFVPGRFATLRDIGYDMLGASLALLYKYRYV